MLKRIIITAIVCILSGSLFGSYFFFVGRLARERSAMELFSGIDVVVLDSLDNSLISSEEVKERLSQWNLRGSCDTINLYNLEEAVMAFGEVAHAEAFRKDSRHIGIVISQRHPAVRFFREEGSYYSDENGYIFPVYHFTDVPIVTGAIPFEIDSSRSDSVKVRQEWVDGIISLAEFISSHRYWKDMTEQIDIADNGDIVLYMKDTRQSVIFGDADKIEEKFGKLEAFYRNILPNCTEKHYSVVNLKYDNQIICK